VLLHGRVTGCPRPEPMSSEEAEPETAQLYPACRPLSRSVSQVELRGSDFKNTATLQGSRKRYP
jgi:hypothetical protein